MLIRHQMVDKKDVKFCDETFNLEKALQFLNQTGYRCVPILDATHTRFAGNIYKVDILEYKENHSLMTRLQFWLKTSRL